MLHTSAYSARHIPCYTRESLSNRWCTYDSFASVHYPTESLNAPRPTAFLHVSRVRRPIIMAVLRGTWATVAVLMALVSAGSCAAERDEFQSIKGRVKLPKTARPPTMRVVLNDGASQEEHSTFTRSTGGFEVCAHRLLYIVTIASASRQRFSRSGVPRGGHKF